jgi:DNA modification methylase
MSSVTASPALVVEFVPLDDLHPDPENPRRISDAELDALERSIRAHGFVLPVLARAATHVVIGGHQRLVAARRAGIETVPAIFLELDPTQAQVLALALNKIGGEFDNGLLARLLARLKERPDVDLSLSGFTDRDVAGLLRSMQVRERRDRPETFDLDATLEAVTGTPRVQPGDVFRLGPHRLGCGDATNLADVERLLDGGHAAMAFCDPPYNVDMGNHGGQQRGQRKRPMANDHLDGAAFEAFARAWAINLVASVSGALYICMSSKELPLVSRVLAEVGAHWSDTIIYAKDRFVMGRAAYHHGYEPIWFGWREGITPFWCGDRDQSDVWQITRPSASPLHASMKPLALMERAIRNSSREGDLVLDLFLGSGSTLIACERTGRICAGLEIDPRYVDVAIRRWEAFTGETAVRDDEGSSRSEG